MKFSYNWLQSFFNEKLPQPEKLAGVLTTHSFEIEDFEKKMVDYILDIDILPNRSHDCFCHRGVAREIATLFNIKFIDREVSKMPFDTEEGKSNLKIKIDDPKLCPRYIGRRIENISVKDSPIWLKEKLEVLEERSINNVVDITNYIMLDLGQPMHVFDADKVKGDIHVRLAQKDEKIELLGDDEAVLDENVLLIADEEGPLAIAGIKGGKRAEVTEATKNIILESANFNASMVRKTSQKLDIKNNSSKRYENEISAELAELAMKYATALVSENASGKNTKIYKMEDVYPRKRNAYKIGISLSEINRILGADLKEKEVEEILDKTGWNWEKVNPIEKVILLARENVGKPYKFGASVTMDAPEMFDCSSFTAYLFFQSGIQIPRMSVDQFVFSEPVNLKDIKIGDLIFSNIEGEKAYHESIEWMKGTKVPEGIDHVGLCLGGGEVIHATGLFNKVVIEKINESERFKNIVGIRRIIKTDEKRFVVTAPFERLDLRIKEDLVEEIGRIYGYENIKSILPKLPKEKPPMNDNFVTIQKIRLALVGLGFSEIYSYAFSGKGKVEIKNPISSDKNFLRDNLKDGLKESLELNFKNASLLGFDEIKIFEIGAVFSKDSEQINVAWGTKNKKEMKIKECHLGETGNQLEIKEEVDIFDLPQNKDVKFKPFSSYPFILRDIAVWTPRGTMGEEVLKIILENTSELLVRHGLFDRFEKDERVSYAFSLVFQSQERTLRDSEINEIMQKTTAALNNRNGWQVR